MVDIAFSTAGLSKRYGLTTALDDIDTEAPLRSVGLLGPNGAGKTTLIRILLGIITPSSGSFNVLGLDAKDSMNEIRDRVGYSPEFSPMIPDVSAMKYVAFMGRLSGLRGVEASQRAHDTLHYVGLGEERYRPLREFSTGMMQKCKLAAALVHDPDFIILDEPTDGLDPKGRKQMLNLIKRLYTEEEKSIMVSSHLLFDVEKVCDYVLVLGQGKLISAGNISDLLLADSEVLRIRVKGDIKLFAEHLRSRNLEVTIENSFVDITRVENVEMIVLEEIHKDPEISIRYMGRKSKSLEDVFVSIVDGRSDME
ncbi:MAG: ATP-binding cassette domain-containing protein [Candidatus Lokiarchaeota archaeon]|nr:ATP-binding cassette domain-containing protein [Candidatus Lokiarchaeota archaeon]